MNIMAEPNDTSYRQPRCKHGWVNPEASCDDCRELKRLHGIIEKAQRLLSVVEIAAVDQADYDAVMAA